MTDLKIPEHERFVVKDFRPEYPIIEIYESREHSDKPGAGRVEVWFDCGIVKIKPSISFGWLKPENSRIWSELLAYAADVAELNSPEVSE